MYTDETVMYKLALWRGVDCTVQRCFLRFYEPFHYFYNFQIIFIRFSKWWWKGQHNLGFLNYLYPVKRFREMSTIKIYRKTDSQWLIHTQSWFCRCTSRCIWLGIKITTERSHIGQGHSKQGGHGLRNHDLSNAHPHGKRKSISPRGFCIHIADY